MLDELSKIYEPNEVEKNAYTLWTEAQSFHAIPPTTDEEEFNPYTIVIPPPNVTAPLHLGHALNNTLQDILIRYKRMLQHETLWMPGTDHAGIATQTMVEKRIMLDEGKRRTDFERQEFITRIQVWKDEYEARIIEQLKLMGCSCDWQRTRFTMDDVCVKAVRANFFNLFKDELIYRGKRLVNWDPATQTVLADDEVEHEKIQGYFWYMQYPLAEPVEIDGKMIDRVTVATTRPETMLGDTAVAMNPSDPRSKSLTGKMIRLPLADRLIPIIADEHVVMPDPESDDEKAKFSTGFLKVTPAHDPDDWAIGQRHDLPVINIMAPDGSISNKHGWEDSAGTDGEQFIGMDRFDARKAIISWFEENGLMEEIRDYTHEVGHSYRSHVPIEPYLSDQWYIAVKKPITHLVEKFGEGKIESTDVPVNSLAGLGLKPLLDSKLQFVPERYERTYQNWLENLRDWPISRQLWWGHQIPIWSKSTDEVKRDGDDINSTTNVEYRSIESNDVLYICACVAPGHEDIEGNLESKGWKRDDDVLDTWFSSALWPFSTLGWPEKEINGEKLLESFYPGDVLCTAREIITLWVSRMVMMGQYCAGDIPFRHVFIHAMIQDGCGQKMSKSLGNGLDPLDVIHSHGADAMRFALSSMTTQTQDVRMPVDLICPHTQEEFEPKMIRNKAGYRVAAPIQNSPSAKGKKMVTSYGVASGEATPTDEMPLARNTSSKFDIGRNFCNKMWNASRFALGNLEGVPTGEIKAEDLMFEDKWILSRLSDTAANVTAQLDEFKFSDPINLLYRFFWNELCDWYLELIKPRMRDEAHKGIAQRVLAFVLDGTFRLLHPFMPFITEGIYQQLNAMCPNREITSIGDMGNAELLIKAAWPRLDSSLVDGQVEQQMELTQTTIRLIRDIRTRYQVPPKQPLNVTIKTDQTITDIITAQKRQIMDQANVESLLVGIDSKKPASAASAISTEMEVYVEGVIDEDAEKERLTKQKEETEKFIKSAQAKLNNENFVNRAKPEVVQRERDRLEQFLEQLETVQKNLADMG